MLTIKISNFPDVRAEYGQTSKEKKFSQLGGTIGRSTQCSWTLKDSSRRVSSKHIQIEYQFGEYYATDISTNGSKLNNLKIEKNVPIKLKTGDVIEIGLYKTVVANISKDYSDDLNSLIPLQDDATSPSSELGFLDEHDLSKKSKALPFEKKNNTSSPYQTRDVFSHLHNDEVFDPNKIGKKSITHSEYTAQDPDKNNLPTDSKDGLGILPENLFLEEKEEVQLKAYPKTDSKLIDIQGQDKIQRNEFIDQEKKYNSKIKQEESENSDLMRLRKLNSESENVSDQCTLPMESNANVGDQDFLNIFCKRTGMNPKIMEQLDKGKLYQDISDILSYSLDGIIRLMMERNSAKSKLDSDLTMFTSQVKNPVKLSMSSKQALETILFDSSDTIMPARQAVGESVSEIVQHFHASDHSIKMVLDNLTSKFNPTEIEKKTLRGKKTMISTLNNSKCWDEYKTMFESELGISKRQVEKNLKDLIADEYNKASQ